MKDIKAFESHIYRSSLGRPWSVALKADLLKDLKKVQLFDQEGQDWSRVNYPGGYTSYSSLSELDTLVPSVRRLKSAIKGHVERYAQLLGFQFKRAELFDCWVNVMPQRVVHSLHLHPRSHISGAFYVQVPSNMKGGEIKFEDPRLSLFMNRPVVKGSTVGQHFIKLKPNEGEIVLFESWMRHEVSAFEGQGERVSISFNYGCQD